MFIDQGARQRSASFMTTRAKSKKQKADAQARPPAQTHTNLLFRAFALLFHQQQ
jgi:hypothetical protein